jgi:hypothetical protein
LFVCLYRKPSLPTRVQFLYLFIDHQNGFYFYVSFQVQGFILQGSPPRRFNICLKG